MTLGGYFQITFNGYVSRPIRHDLNADQMKTALELDWGLVTSDMTITRSPNTYCACIGAYSWTMTWAGWTGQVPEMVVTTNALTGAGATVGDGKGSLTAVTVQNSPYLGGSFYLKYGDASTSALDADIDSHELKTKLEDDLNLPITLYV